MAASALALVLASACAFGVDAWFGFFLHTQPVLSAMLAAPYEGLPMQATFASAFMAARSVGVSVSCAYVVQGVVTLLCGFGAWRLWRGPARNATLRAAATSLLAIAAAPWVHSYDMIPLAVAIVGLSISARGAMWILLGFAWVWPGSVVLLPIPMPLSVASMLGIAYLVLRAARSSGSAYEADVPAVADLWVADMRAF
jgi:hypothetical protein